MWFRIKPEEGQIKKTIEKIKNKKLSMGTDSTDNLPVCYNIGRINPFLKEFLEVKIMREKLKKLKLDHLVDESEDI